MAFSQPVHIRVERGKRGHEEQQAPAARQHPQHVRQGRAVGFYVFEHIYAQNRVEVEARERRHRLRCRDQAGGNAHGDRRTSGVGFRD